MNSKLLKTESGKQMLLTVAVLVLIMALTVIAFEKVHSYAEKNCYEELRSNTKIADWQVSDILNTTYFTLKNIGAVVTQQFNLDEKRCSELFDHLYIGDMQMETRMYMPDGRIITENGLWSEKINPDEYNEILNNFDSDNRYISCAKKDYIHADAMIMEIYYPIIESDETVAVLSAIMHLSELKKHIKKTAYKGSSNIVVIDRRDGTYFMDSDHKEILNVDYYRDRVDEKGKSISNKLDQMMNGDEVSFTIKSKRSGNLLYNYSIPSKAYSYWSTSISTRKSTVFASAIYIRNLLIIITLCEIVIFISYILWLQKITGRETKKLLKSIAANYTVAYVVNLETDGFKQLRMDDNMIGANESFNNFTEAKTFFINLLPESDRGRMIHELDYGVIKEKLSKIKTYNIEYRLQIDKAMIWHEMSVTKIDDNNVAIGFAVRDQEITKKHLEDRRYSEFFALFELDFDTELLKVIKDSPYFKIAEPGSALPYSETMCRFAQSLDQEACEFFTKLADIKYLKKQFKTEDKLTYSYRSNNVGKKNWIDCTGYVTLRHEDGAPAMFAFGFSLMDKYGILRQKLQKQQKENILLLEEAREAAEAANAAKTNFLFNMSHDIRTPMNAITGFTNIAIKHINDKAKVRDSLEKTQKAGNMLLSIINSVLEVSRIESGHVTIETLPADINYSFYNLENTLGELAATKDIKLTFEFGKITDRYVYVDFSHCTGAFVNIISNAIKYTPEGGYVKVKCEQLGQAKDGYATYQYTFEDNGIGMSEDFQQHIFEQFSRENNATVSGIQGTGLGMSIVKSYVELMGGTVSVKSKKGKGSKFTVILPFKLQENSMYTDPVTGEVVNVAHGNELDKTVEFTGKKILLVEDNELNSEIANEILVDEGFVVENADDGTKAVEILKEKGPEYYNFILMDIQMPVMNGYEATKEIRKMYPNVHIPIIALSANAFSEDKAFSRDAGMDGHVAKPINVKELLNVLSKCLKIS